MATPSTLERRRSASWYADLPDQGPRRRWKMGIEARPTADWLRSTTRDTHIAIDHGARNVFLTQTCHHGPQIHAILGIRLPAGNVWPSPDSQDRMDQRDSPCLAKTGKGRVTRRPGDGGGLTADNRPMAISGAALSIEAPGHRGRNAGERRLTFAVVRCHLHPSLVPTSERVAATSRCRSTSFSSKAEAR